MARCGLIVEVRTRARMCGIAARHLRKDVYTRVYTYVRTHHVCTYEFEIKRFDAYVCTRAIDNFRAGCGFIEPRQIGFARARASYLETVKLHKTSRIEL